MIAPMESVLALRPVGEPDLAVLERITQHRDAAGEYTWTGWRNLLRFREGWAEDRLVGEEGGVLMVVHRVEAATETQNMAEQRALEKAGFTREGVLRAVGWRDGAYRDGVWYSMLRTDLPQPG
jgi:hypothetical protein